jgi:hypothetical protein
MPVITKTFAESTARTQTQSLTIPKLKSIKSVTVNTGTVTYSVSDQTITFQLQNGSVSRTVQTGGSYTPADSKTVTDSRTSSSNNLPSSIPYNSGGYSGTLYGQGVTQTVVSGSAGDSKTVTETRTYEGSVFEAGNWDQVYAAALAGLPSSISYNSGGYTGTLTKTSAKIISQRTKKSGDSSTFYATAEGTYSGTVTKPDTRVYQYSQNYSGIVTKPASDTRTYAYYYQYTVTVDYVDNSSPTLTLSTDDNQVLSEGAAFIIQGSVQDADSGNVVTVKYKINSGTARAVVSRVSDGSSPISFTRTLTYGNKRLWDGATDIAGADLPEGVDHTLTVWAEDDQGGKSAEITRKFRVIHNRPPAISGQDGDIGSINTPPSLTYTVADPEGSTFTITEKLNDTVIRTFTGQPGVENTMTIPHDLWLPLEPGVPQTLKIEATDSAGIKSVRMYMFTRTEDRIVFDGLDFANLPPDLLDKFTTDVPARRILLTPDWTIPPGAVVLVEACNNAFDAQPTWEDVTFHARNNRGYLFLNQQKTADKWGVNFRFTIEKGTATDPIIVKGIGGAFD